MGHLTGDPKKDVYWHQQAQYMHVLCVSDAIRDTYVDAVAASQKLASPEASLQLRFGVARRTKFIWLSQRGLLQLIHPEHEEPLPNESVEEASGNLNAIYINIRGTLDNFAWCFLELFGDKNTRQLHQSKVQLFGTEFLKDPNLKEMAAFLEKFTKWNTELKERRDPAAHRIPLSIPPAILDEATHKEYARIAADYTEAFNAAFKCADNTERPDLFRKVDVLHDQLGRLGKFVPLFGHHPDERHMRIYPTVPQDIGRLVQIARGLLEITLKKAGV